MYEPPIPEFPLSKTIQSNNIKKLEVINKLLALKCVGINCIDCPINKILMKNNNKDCDLDKFLQSLCYHVRNNL